MRRDRCSLRTPILLNLQCTLNPPEQSGDHVRPLPPLRIAQENQGIASQAINWEEKVIAWPICRADGPSVEADVVDGEEDKSEKSLRLARLLLRFNSDKLISPIS